MSLSLTDLIILFMFCYNALVVFPQFHKLSVPNAFVLQPRFLGIFY